MRDIAITLVVFGSIPLIFLRPHLGILMWAWIAYMVPHRLTWGFAYDFPFAQVIAITTIGAWLISREPKKLPINNVTVLLLLLTFWITLTTIFAFVPDKALDEWNRAVKISLMNFLTIILMGSRKRIHILLWVIVVSVGFYGVKGGFFVLSGRSGLIWGPQDSFFADNNALALTLIMIIPLMRYLQLQAQSRWVSFGFLIAIFLSGASIIGTYSRGAFLGAIAMGLFLIWKSRSRWLFGALALVALVLFAPFVPDKWIDRMQTIRTYEEDASAMGRIHAWSFAWKVAQERPIIGGGFGAINDTERWHRYVPESQTIRDYHSNYFEILGGHGFVGLGIFLALLFATYNYGTHIIRETKGNPDLQWASDLANMVQVSLVGYAVTGLFLKLAFFDLFYHLVAIQVLTRLIVQKVKSGEMSDEAKKAVTRSPPLSGSSSNREPDPI